MSHLNRKKALLFVSADTDYLYEEGIRILSSNFELLDTFRMNRNSPGISSIRSSIESFGQVHYIFNFLSPKIFPTWLLKQAEIACINVHPASYEYPGVGSASYSLYDNKSEYGVSAHYMTEKIDNGGIFAERFFDQSPYRDCRSLFERALEECPSLLEDVVKSLRSKEKPEVIRKWAKRAATRAEFEAWMHLAHLPSSEEWEKKIQALSHPNFPGPYLKLGEHTFVLNPKN